MNTQPFRIVKHRNEEFKVYEPTTDEKSKDYSLLNTVMWGIPVLLFLIDKM